MESTTAAGGGGGIGGPAPFLLKTYDMVDDSSTDEIVSWSSTNQSFVVWNPPEFSRLLLPIYFKHNNFSSFIRQLNTYGFHKVDPERWEFANEDFVKDEKLLLKNIQRRKPIHSHSHSSGSVMDPERMAFDEEIERLTREKVAFETSLSRFEQKQMAAKAQLEDLTHQISGMEQRQANLLAYLEKAIRNPTFVEHLTQKIDSTDILANNKKRRLPRADHSQPVSGISFTEDQASSRGESENMVKQDLSSKLSLELSPAFSDINLASNSTDKNAGSAEKKSSEGDINDISKRKETRSYAIETLDLSDTGTSFASEMGPSLPQEQEQNSLHHCLNSSEESDCHVSFHLNLTLASSPLQANKSQHSSTKTKFGHKLGNFSALRPHTSGKEVVFGSTSPKTRTSSGGDASLPCLNQAPTRNEGPPPALVRVNDVFWEQFLTESPGSSDAREAKS